MKFKDLPRGALFVGEELDPLWVSENRRLLVGIEVPGAGRVGTIYQKLVTPIRDDVREWNAMQVVNARGELGGGICFWGPDSTATPLGTQPSYQIGVWLGECPEDERERLEQEAVEAHLAAGGMFPLTPTRWC